MIPCNSVLFCNAVLINRLLLLLYPTPGKLKNQHDHGGNRTRDLWFASPMLYQLSYEVKSVRVFDISELNLAPSISVCF